jgi:hypothetical protein
VNVEKMCDHAVPARLGDNAFAGVDKDDRQFRDTRAGRHVPRILLVTGCIGENKLPPRRREIAVGDVNRDALFALRLESIEQQGKIEIICRGASLRLSPSSTVSSSSERWPISYRSRPMSVLFPSSTLPQVMKRNRPISLPGRVMMDGYQLSLE